MGDLVWVGLCQQAAPRHAAVRSEKPEGVSPSVRSGSTKRGQWLRVNSWLTLGEKADDRDQAIA